MKKDPRGGRPSLSGTSETVRVTVRVTAGQRLQLRRVATARGVRFSEVVRAVIDEQIDADDDDREKS